MTIVRNTYLFIFIYRIIHNTLTRSMEMFEPCFIYYFFNTLLMVLQALHIFWFGIILRMVYKLLEGKVRFSDKSKINKRTSLTNICNN